MDEEQKVLTPGTESDYVADLVTMPGAADSCTPADVNNKVPGCASVGSMPGVNVSPYILVRAYGGKEGAKTNLSVPNKKDDPYFRAQQGYLSYSRPRPGPAIRDAAKNKPVSRQFLIMQRRYNSRALAVVGAMTQVASQTLAIDPKSPFMANVWNAATVQGGNTLKQDFSEVYGSAVPVPAVPSEREIMNLLVLRQFSEKQAGSDLVPSPLDVARRPLDVKKINALMLLKLNEKAEWNNIMYAHILSNRIDPVNREGLLSSAAAAN
jgi:hypothetical protein